MYPSILSTELASNFLILNFGCFVSFYLYLFLRGGLRPAPRPSINCGPKRNPDITKGKVNLFQVLMNLKECITSIGYHKILNTIRTIFTKNRDPAAGVRIIHLN